MKTLNKQQIERAIWLTALIVIFFIGALVDNIPYFTIKNEVDIGGLVALVALVALFSATLLVPLKINSITANRRSKNSVLSGDIGEILEALSAIRIHYENIYFEDKYIQPADQKRMLSAFRNTANLIDLLKEQVDSEGSLKNFDSDVALKFNRSVRLAYTDKFQAGQKIQESDCITAIAEMDQLVSSLKKIRYQIYD